MELTSLSVCDLNTNKAGNGGNLRFPSQPSLTIKKRSIYYDMSDKDTKLIHYDVSSVVLKPTIAQEWVKIGGESYQPTKPKKNKKIVPNNDNIQTGLWD